MIRLIAETGAKVVLSYSPVLLEQIADIAAGRWNRAALITAKPAAELTAEDKAYMDDVFFIASPAQIDRYPRYRELVTRRDQGRHCFAHCVLLPRRSSDQTTGMRSVPRPSINTSITSPFTTGPTPAGVPDRITSPGASSK